MAEIIENWIKKDSFSEFHLFFDFLNRLNIDCEDKKLEVYLYSWRLLLLTSIIEGLPLYRIARLQWDELYDCKDGKISLKEETPYRKNILAMPEYLNNQFISYYKLVYNPLVKTSFMKNKIFLSRTGKAIDDKNIPLLLKEIMPLMEFKYADKFNVDSTLIMFGRRIIEVKGLNKKVIRFLRTHLTNVRTELEVLNFLEVTKKGIENNEIRNDILTGLI